MTHCITDLDNRRDPADHIDMMCENCGAPMRLLRDQGLMTCDYCGSQATPTADEEGVIANLFEERAAPGAILLTYHGGDEILVRQKRTKGSGRPRRSSIRH